ncbi:hypothetical protein [Algivirga pacifica]|uniref:Uncharacterized protein n=1 Tax=Algivirga pacifica TaxID=1162670 RepID=A0ABP9D5Y9_9BACT
MVLFLAGGFLLWYSFFKSEKTFEKNRYEIYTDYVEDNIKIDIPSHLSNQQQVIIELPILDLDKYETQIINKQKKINALNQNIMHLWDAQNEGKDIVIEVLEEMVTEAEKIKHSYEISKKVTDLYLQQGKHYTTAPAAVQSKINRLRLYQEQHIQSYENLAGACEEMLLYVKDASEEVFDYSRGELLYVQLQEAQSFLFSSAQEIVISMYQIENLYNRLRPEEQPWFKNNMDPLYIALQDLLLQDIIIDKEDLKFAEQQVLFKKGTSVAGEYLNGLHPVSQAHVQLENIKEEVKELSNKKEQVSSLLQGRSVELVKDVRVGVGQTKKLLKITQDSLKLNGPVSYWYLTLSPLSEGNTTLQFNGSIAIKDLNTQETHFLKTFINKAIVVE